MILRCDVASLVLKVDGRNILPTVAKRHLGRSGPRGQRQELVAHADAENRCVSLCIA